MTSARERIREVLGQQGWVGWKDRAVRGSPPGELTSKQASAQLSWKEHSRLRLCEVSAGFKEQ